MNYINRVKGGRCQEERRPGTELWEVTSCMTQREKLKGRQGEGE